MLALKRSQQRPSSLLAGSQGAGKCLEIAAAVRRAVEFNSPAASPASPALTRSGKQAFHLGALAEGSPPSQTAFNKSWRGGGSNGGNPDKVAQQLGRFFQFRLLIAVFTQYLLLGCSPPPPFVLMTHVRGGGGREVNHRWICPRALSLTPPRLTRPHLPGLGSGKRVQKSVLCRWRLGRPGRRPWNGSEQTWRPGGASRKAGEGKAGSSGVFQLVVGRPIPAALLQATLRALLLNGKLGGQASLAWAPLACLGLPLNSAFVQAGSLTQSRPASLSHQLASRGPKGKVRSPGAERWPWLLANDPGRLPYLVARRGPAPAGPDGESCGRRD